MFSAAPAVFFSLSHPYQRNKIELWSFSRVADGTVDEIQIIYVRGQSCLSFSVFPGVALVCVALTILFRGPVSASSAAQEIYADSIFDSA